MQITELRCDAPEAFDALNQSFDELKDIHNNALHLVLCEFWTFVDVLWSK